MRLIAEGLAARGHRVRLRLAAPGRRCRSPQRFAVNGVEVLLCANPRRSLLAPAARPGCPAATAGSARRSTPAAGRGCAGRCSGRKARRRPTSLYGFYEMEFLAQALPRATRRAPAWRSSCAWPASAGYDAIRARPRPPAPRECARIFNGGRRDQLPLGEPRAR